MIFDQLAPFLDFSEAALMSAILCFIRVAAIVGLLPGFGETFIPVRQRLGVALAFSMITWPMLDATPLAGDWTPLRFGRMVLAEAVIGIVIGLGFRLLVMALQLAGSIAAQTTSLAQIAGAGVMPDPMPALGNLLIISGIALALVLDLHIKVVAALITTYDLIGFGGHMPGADVAAWGLHRATQAFALAFSLSAPFLIAGFLYNVALGAINRAMPQLMVAFVGAPAITGATLLLLFLAAPLILTLWTGTLDRALANPLSLN